MVRWAPRRPKTHRTTCFPREAALDSCRTARDEALEGKAADCPLLSSYRLLTVSERDTALHAEDMLLDRACPQR
jgi:hypothetical protein